MIRSILILSCLMFAAAAQEAGRGSASTNWPQYNFLFVIDTSASMTQRKPAAIQMVREVINSGFNGQIEPGDSVDIWTYDSENHIARFPPQIWETSDKDRLATVAARFLERQKFGGRSRFLPVAADLEALLPHTSSLLAVMITDAEQPIAGIHLDLEINEYLARNKKSRRSAKHPLLVSLGAVHGRFGEWTVYDGEGELKLATLPVRPAPLPVLATVEPEKEPEPEPEPEPLLVFDYPPGTRVTPIVPAPEPEPVTIPNEKSAATEISSETATELEETVNSVAAVVTPPPPPANLNDSNPPAKKPEPSDVAPVAAAAPAASPAPSANQEKSSQPAQPKPVQPAPVVVEKAVAKTAVAPAKPIFKSPSGPAMALTTPAFPKNAIYISLGAGLCFFVAGVLLLLRRLKAGRGTSIISKSLQQ